MDERQLRRLREKVFNNVRALILQDELKVEDRLLLGPPLIAQLRQAVANGREAGVRTKSTHRVPISIAAHDLLTAIATETKNWSEKDTIEDRIRDANNWVHSSGDGVIQLWLKETTEWVRKIKELFDPPNRYHLSAPCPECNQTSVRKFNPEDREYVKVPALQIVKVNDRTVCRCVGCGTEWPEEHFLLLAKAIGVE